MSKKRQVIRLEVDEPVLLKFNFSEPIPSEGKYGMQFYYGVMKENDSEYYGLYATEKLNKMLLSLGNLYGRYIEIEKKVNEQGTHYWTLRENGEEISLAPSEYRRTKSEKIEEENSRLDEIEERLRKVEKSLFG